ncbi:hypothetical protein K523DRAFT_366031 [Schizophyllum commune Tattone D]|nr:hypothetical protein K523DRAFT_366031 [Schizophyllum commune Tattone D]
MTKRSLRTAEQERPGLCAHLAGSLCRDLATVIEFGQQRYFGGRQQAPIDLEPYRERLTHVAMLAIELNESVGFGVSSEPLVVFTAQTGQVFDRRSMLDFWSDPVEATESARDQQKEEIVVGSCALGLKRESDSVDDENEIDAQAAWKVKKTPYQSYLQIVKTPVPSIPCL